MLGMNRIIGSTKRNNNLYFRRIEKTKKEKIGTFFLFCVSIDSNRIGLALNPKYFTRVERSWDDSTIYTTTDIVCDS